jgi:hypothetical protein
MRHLNSLAIGLIAIISIAPAAQAFTPISHSSVIEQPAQNLQAQVTINVGIGLPAPQQRVIVVETQPRPRSVILVETSYPQRVETRYQRYERYSKRRGYGKKYKQKNYDRKEYDRHDD